VIFSYFKENPMRRLNQAALVFGLALFGFSWLEFAAGQDEKSKDRTAEKSKDRTAAKIAEAQAPARQKTDPARAKSEALQNKIEALAKQRVAALKKDGKESKQVAGLNAQIAKLKAQASALKNQGPAKHVKPAIPTQAKLPADVEKHLAKLGIDLNRDVGQIKVHRGADGNTIVVLRKSRGQEPEQRNPDGAARSRRAGEEAIIGGRKDERVRRAVPPPPPGAPPPPPWDDDRPQVRRPQRSDAPDAPGRSAARPRTPDFAAEPPRSRSGGDTPGPIEVERRLRAMDDRLNAIERKLNAVLERLESRDSRPGPGRFERQPDDGRPNSERPDGDRAGERRGPQPPPPPSPPRDQEKDNDRSRPR
jgi:hypothetical protein